MLIYEKITPQASKFIPGAAKEFKAILMLLRLFRRWRFCEINNSLKQKRQTQHNGTADDVV